ncbi:MAG: lipoprotein-releasing ABC transporter permease subunit [Gammaproteobacteria bacterium]|nr:lipoprotein-releasing ABC transporter permease subunit [Gammaproteobacteria bacterium]
MIRPVALWMALRYLRTQRASQFASLVGLASVLGVALGVAALIVVLSVMNGFENELRARLVTITGHGAVLTGAAGDDWRTLRDELGAWPGIVAAEPYVELEAMLANGGELAGVVIEGIDPQRDAAFAGERASIFGDGLLELRPGSFQALLGRALAARLGLAPGDRVRVMVPVRDVKGRVVSRLREIIVAGVFEIGVRDHDSVRVLLNLADAAQLAGLGGNITGIRLQMADIFAAPEVLHDWTASRATAGHAGLATTDWTRDNASYFRAVRIEKVMMTLLLSLIVAVATFNIVATLVMIVTDKRPGIAILRTLGFSRRSIIATFTLQGLLIGWAGVVIGLLSGSLLARNIAVVVPALEKTFGFEFMPADVYYLTSLPVDLQVDDFLWVSVIALLMTAGATIYPALRAASVDPAEVLRYE